MISIFRKIRKNLIKSNKITAYILYALGEIFLVMIGILLALQVNNWNEKRNQEKELNNIFRTIATDISVDTTSASRIIKFYEENSKNSLKIINRELNMDNYKECPQCIGLVTIYQPFNIQTGGFERLKTITKSSQQDSLVSFITEVYSQFTPLIEKSNDRMEQTVLENFKDFEEFPWFVDLFQGKVNDEMISYFVESEDYRNRVAAHNILAAGNHLNITKVYKTNAIEILNRIHKRLNLNKE